VLDCVFFPRGRPSRLALLPSSTATQLQPRFCYACLERSSDLPTHALTAKRSPAFFRTGLSPLPSLGFRFPFDSHRLNKPPMLGQSGKRNTMAFSRLLAATGSVHRDCRVRLRRLNPPHYHVCHPRAFVGAFSAERSSRHALQAGSSESRPRCSCTSSLGHPRKASRSKGGSPPSTPSGAGRRFAVRARGTSGDSCPIPVD
jgi:hypothetical protein